MVRAWFLKNITDGMNREEENFAKDGEELDLVTLNKLTGCYVNKVDPVTYEFDGKLAQIRREGGYNYNDFVELSEAKFGASYSQLVSKFFIEHLHTDPEIRFCIEGRGYFDVRSEPTDEWIRVEVGPGDLLFVPAGIYHRFTLDTSRYIKCMRLFCGVPKWTSYPRTPLPPGPVPAGFEETLGDQMPERAKYLAAFPPQP